MLKEVRILLIVLLCSMVVAGCHDRSYNDKKSLIRAVQKFYDAIVEVDMAVLYDSFPESFTAQFNKEQFLKSVSDQPQEFVLNAFSLMKIKTLFYRNCQEKKNQENMKLPSIFIPTTTSRK